MKTVIACVTENRPSWFTKVLNLVQSVRAFAGTLADAPIVVVVIDDCDPRFRLSLERLGAGVRVAPPVDPVVRYANKLRMFELQDLDFDMLLALDCDTVVVGDPSDHLRPDAVGLKPVDRNYLSLEQWRRLYASVDLSLPRPRYRTTSDDEQIHGYFNSGVVAVPSEQAAALAHLWLRYIFELSPVFDRDPELALWRRYNDQFALSCALASGGFTVRPLPVSMNFPTHVRVDPSTMAASERPIIIHYHNDIDERGFLLRGRYELLNAQLDRFNRLRAEAIGLPYGGLTDPPPSRRVTRFLSDRGLLQGQGGERVKQRARAILARLGRAR